MSGKASGKSIIVTGAGAGTGVEARRDLAGIGSTLRVADSESRAMTGRLK